MNESYENKSQRHLMVVVEALAATPLVPQTTEELHRKVKGVSKDQVWRALQNLEAQGWAEKRGGGWAVSPRLTRLSERLRIDIAQAHHAYLAPPELTRGNQVKADIEMRPPRLTEDTPVIAGTMAGKPPRR